MPRDSNENGSMIMNIRVITFLVIVLLPWAWVQGQGRATGEGFRQQYKLILERNIFSRDRRPYVPRERRRDFRPPPPIETDYCLKGIARENKQLTAFIEQLSTGMIERYTLDAKIARGTIKTITLDMVEYALGPGVLPNDLTKPSIASDPNDPRSVGPSPDPNDPNAIGAAAHIRVTRVRIGQTLQGLAPGNTTSFATVIEDFAATVDATSASEETSAETEPLGDEESDILKRLMERRRQELGD